MSKERDPSRLLEKHLSQGVLVQDGLKIAMGKLMDNQAFQVPKLLLHGEKRMGPVFERQWFR